MRENAVARFVYTGDQQQTYPQYLDAEQGRTLVAEPGRTYDITPADGQAAALPMPPDGRWAKPSKEGKA